MPKETAIGVPTAGGVSSAFGDYFTGALGGLLVSLSQRFLGVGFLGSLLAPIIASAAIKGTRGQMLATVAGFFGAASLISQLGQFGGTTNDDVM